ncbi:MAG: methanogenesis marker 17 protein [Nitrososphaerales archaeon]
MSIVTVESDDKEAGSIYEKIVLDVLSGLHFQLIDRLYVKININEGYFIISATIKKNIKPLRLSDISSLDPIRYAVGTRITIDPVQESYLPAMIKLLTSVVGKERITQPSRYEIIVKDIEPSEIRDLVVFDYTTYAQTIVTEVLFWIAPEQFKINHVLNDGETVTVLFSEYDLKESWLHEQKKVHESMKTKV